MCISLFISISLYFSLSLFQHLVYSSLARASVISGGELTKIYHFNSKGDVQAYAEEYQEDEMIVYFYLAGLYMSN